MTNPYPSKTEHQVWFDEMGRTSQNYFFMWRENFHHRDQLCSYLPIRCGGLSLPLKSHLVEPRHNFNHSKKLIDFKGLLAPLNSNYILSQCLPIRDCVFWKPSRDVGHASPPSWTPKLAACVYFMKTREIPIQCRASQFFYFGENLVCVVCTIKQQYISVVQQVGCGWWFFFWHVRETF